MKLIAGLGNPGKQYQDTFHNLGFSVLDNIKEKLRPISQSNKFKSIIYKGEYENVDYILLYPQTYMNLSGFSVVNCLNFYKICLSDLLVICDSLDLALAKVRFKEKGSHGGHNGLRDIIQKLSNNDFSRLTIGIGRPQEKSQVINYVLKKIPNNFKNTLQKSINQATEISCNFIISK